MLCLWLSDRNLSLMGNFLSETPIINLTIIKFCTYSKAIDKTNELTQSQPILVKYQVSASRMIVCSNTQIIVTSFLVPLAAGSLF